MHALKNPVLEMEANRDLCIEQLCSKPYLPEGVIAWFHSIIHYRIIFSYIIFYLCSSSADTWVLLLNEQYFH